MVFSQSLKKMKLQSLLLHLQTIKSDIEFNNYYSKTKDSLDTAISTDEDVVEGYEKIDDTLEEFFDKYTLTSNRPC